MEMEEIQTQAPPSKLPRIDLDSLKVGHSYPVEEEDNSKLGTMTTGMAAADTGANRFRGWHHSRIIRVSRTSGGKDRHSKVLTSKGLRDRRVRLSVSTAIQFYDIQDRLGVDQPSKAVEWLISQASEAIAELPSLNTFPDTPKQLSDEKRVTEHGFDSADVAIEEDDPNYQQQPRVSLSKSACSSTSETSKGSGLSLSRSEVNRVNRVKKSRKRARERAAKEKEEKEKGPPQPQAPLAIPISQNSFTELLTAGITNNSNSSPLQSAHQLNQESRHWVTSGPMEYLNAGQLLSRSQNLPGFLGQIQLPQAMPLHVPTFSISGEGNNGNNNNNNHHHHEMQHISFVNPEHYTSSSPGLVAGFNRGTLQSNLPHFQRFTSPHHHHVDGSTNNLPFFIETSHHHNQIQQLHMFASGVDGRLQLSYGEGNGHAPTTRGKAAKR